MAPADSYQALIFDYGGVLVHHQTDEDQKRLAQLAGISPDRFTESYWANRVEYDKGIVSAADYWQTVVRESGKSLSETVIDELVELDTTSWMQFDAVMWDWIAQLRSTGKRVAMLSNMPPELGEALKARTDKMKAFDQVTLSYEVHSVKPERTIYEHCLDGLGIRANQALFLDDRMVNVEGAEILGIRALQFTSRDEVLARLRRRTD